MRRHAVHVPDGCVRTPLFGVLVIGLQAGASASTFAVERLRVGASTLSKDLSLDR